MDNKVLRNIFIVVVLSAAIIYFVETKANPKEKSKKFIFIGDSHAVMIGEKIKGAIIDNQLAKSGWALPKVFTNLKAYPINKEIGKVFISIGTNEGFAKSDKIEEFVDELKRKFPNADLYIFKGSYGWSGKYENPNAERDLIPFYKRFQDNGVSVLKSGLGYFKTDAQAHSTSSTQAKSIIEEIKNIING
jgi:hypothetical protein